MSLLESHLEQITLSANAILDLAFPPPKIFTNALLNNHDITALIRDTEAHERALFSVDPSAKSFPSSQRRATRRGTIYPTEGSGESMASRIYAARNNRNQSAVARVLGTDMMEEIKRSSGRAPRGEINVDVLLKGAEILCNVYPIAGAAEKISSLRYRYQQLTESIAELEARVAKNAAELERMSQAYDHDEDDFEDAPQQEAVTVTDEDIERELEEIRELERKKRALEERVTGMERDLGSLMR
ncbi:hypothetical protein VTN77DRAFT_1657 [Rasamsonia byssochlamydoides]|uniref:uncharacterized protein n=1 Tax=Rasamsonia byssochlamydoides TaxID=89139 RepID=UPI003744608A